MTIPHESIPPRVARRVIADEYDDLNLDFNPKHLEQVNQAAKVITLSDDEYEDLNLDFNPKRLRQVNQAAKVTLPSASVAQSRFAKINDPWTTKEAAIPPSILESNIFPGTKAASPIINDPLAGRHPWLREESAPPIPTGYQPIPVQLHIPEFENFDQSYRQVSNNPPASIPTGYQASTVQPHIPGFEEFDQSYRNVITAPGQVPTTSPHYVEQTVLPLETGNEQLQLPLYSQPTDAANDRIPYEAFKKPQYGLLDGAWKGLKSGFNYGLGEEGERSRSAVFHRAPSYEYDYLPEQGRVAYGVGRVAGDIVGYGTRSNIWRSQPPDISGTYSGKGLRAAGGSRLATIVGPFAVTSAMDFGSNIYNPLNLSQGGRAAGYQANSPDPDDHRKSTSPVYDLAVEKGLFGRRGSLLPWEQFKQERPDISYQQYADYKNYLFNKDDNLLRKATLGLVKGDMDGINGPEISIAGYGVTPLGVAAALGTYGAIRHGIGRVGVLTR